MYVRVTYGGRQGTSLNSRKEGASLTIVKLGGPQWWTTSFSYDKELFVKGLFICGTTVCIYLCTFIPVAHWGGLDNSVNSFIIYE